MLREREHDSLGYPPPPGQVVVWEAGAPETARAGVSYRSIGSVSLASGDPVGDPTYWPQAIERWRDESHRAGRSLAVMGAGHQGALAYAEAGLTMLDIGDEAVGEGRGSRSPPRG